MYFFCCLLLLLRLQIKSVNLDPPDADVGVLAKDYGRGLSRSFPGRVSYERGLFGTFRVDHFSSPAPPRLGILAQRVKGVLGAFERD